MLLLDEVQLPGHVAGRQGVVAGDHHDLWTEDKATAVSAGRWLNICFTFVRGRYRICEQKTYRNTCC